MCYDSSMTDYPRPAGKAFNRLLVPASFVPIVLTIVALNLLVQVCYALGLFAHYDGAKASYVISLGYLIAVAKEAIAILRGH